MNKLSLLSVAAVAALAATPVAAQLRGGHGGAGAGVSWQGGGMRTGGGTHVRTGGGFQAGGGAHFRSGARTGGGFTAGHRGGTVVRHGGPNVVVRHNGGGNVRFRHNFRPGHNFPRRVHRGFNIHPFWFGPQFHINNWQAYGFADPGPDRRWVRYYDDAYMIDRGGRVVDERYGLDWDQYGERWEEEDGVPSYYGSREYFPGEEDYAWVDEHGGERGYDYAEGGYEGPEDPPMGYGPPPGHGPGPVQYGHGGPGYARTQVYGGGYGGPAYGYGAYGYGWAYPIVIETTVTTGGGYTEEITEETVEVRRAYRPRRSCNCRRAAPVRHAPPPAGERG